MEELGHEFFVFVNAETERVAILYARDDGDYGMIEPVVGGRYTRGGAVADEPRRDTAPFGRPAAQGPLTAVTRRMAVPDGRRLGAHLPLGQGDGRAIERAARDRGERHPGLQRQSDGVAPARWAAKELRGVPAPARRAGHRAARDPRLVPRQPAPAPTRTSSIARSTMLAAELSDAPTSARAS